MELLPGTLDIEGTPFEQKLWNDISYITSDKSGILGYKNPSLDTTDVEEIPSFIIRSKDNGILLFQVIDNPIVSISENEEFWGTEAGNSIFSPDIILNNYFQQLKARLTKDSKIFNRKKDKLEIPEIRTYLVFSLNKKSDIESIPNFTESLINSVITTDNYDETLTQIFQSTEYEIKENLLDIINSLLEGTDVYKSIKKESINDIPETKNEYIKKSLDFTWKLDEVQRSIAMQIPAGPQRIRGLAGTGKTIILCMKAANAHKFFKDYNILFLFNNQSMYSHIERNIQTYYVSETKKTFNPDKLQILHAWGGKNIRGFYSSICEDLNIKPKTFYELRHLPDPNSAIFEDLLKNHKSKLKPKYDLVLIDEAQDFSPALFETIFYLTKHNLSVEEKKIVWAYDEFQSLKELKIREPEELFGKNIDGAPNLLNSALEGEYTGGIKKDFVLPNSYRNPRVNLMIAHGIGLGLYSTNTQIPMPEKRTWEARGYKVLQPDKSKFDKNDQVEIERPNDNSKNILENLLVRHNRQEKELVTTRIFNTKQEENNFVINEIKNLINNEKVEPEEIIVITLDTFNSEKDFTYIRSKLNQLEIKCITPGYIEDANIFKEPGRVTLTTAFRAKGNESNIVFVLNSNKVINDFTFRSRNSFFVAVTRSRGWCYISANSILAPALSSEIDAILSNYPKFKFIYPDQSLYNKSLQIIMASDKKIDLYEKEIENKLKDETYKALLLEMIAKDPDLFKELKEKIDE